LLRLPREGQLPVSVRRYLDTAEARRAQTAYKCRNREPWYSVPDVRIPDFFLAYMSGRHPSLVSNAARCTCTNSVHAVRLRTPGAADSIVRAWDTPLARLSCELEGHPLGGGMLKLEPGEASRVALPLDSVGEPGHRHCELLRQGVRILQEWRHYAA